MAEDIFTIKPSGGDYSSMSSFEADRQGDLSVRNIQVAEFYTFAGGLNDNNAFVGWSNPDATHYVALRAADGEQHDGTRSTGFYFNRGAASNYTIRPVVGCSWMRVEGLAQIGAGLFANVNGATNLTANRLAVFDCIGSALLVPVQQNTLIVNSSGAGHLLATAGSLTHCQVHDCAGRGFILAHASASATNCISTGNVDADYDIQGGATLSYSISEDASAVGTGCLASRAVKQAADLPLAAGNYVI